MGNFVTIVLAGSFINTLKGVGMDKIAMVTIFTSSARQAKFQMITSDEEIFFFATRYAITKAESPEMISKLRPSNVICIGARLSTNNLHIRISTTILKL